MRILFLLILLLGSRFLGWCQKVPDLVDSVLVCHPGIYPYYVSNEDSACLEKYYYASGELKAVGTCKNGVKTGRWTSYFESGDTMSSGLIQDGHLVGYWIFNHENGQPKARGNFTVGRFERGCAGSENYDSVTVMTGEWKFWNVNGVNTLQCQFDKNEYHEESLNGRFLKRFANGQIMEEGVYKNGMKTGVWTHWYSNGQMKKQEQYAYKDCNIYDYVWHECPTGEWKYWNPDGTLEKLEVYVDGVLVSERKK